MIDIKLILLILLVHWFADFVMQSDEEARNKHKNIERLVDHTFSYSATWFFVSMAIMFVWNLPPKFLWFAPITFVFHTLTDYYTSKINHSYYRRNRIHSFFVSVGFDQWLHYVQLFLTYWWLSK